MKLVPAQAGICGSRAFWAAAQKENIEQRALPDVFRRGEKSLFQFRSSYRQPYDCHFSAKAPYFCSSHYLYALAGEKVHHFAPVPIIFPLAPGALLSEQDRGHLHGAEIPEDQEGDNQSDCEYPVRAKHAGGLGAEQLRHHYEKSYRHQNRLQRRQQ